MKCTLNGPNARIIARAIQSLSKYGVDLFIEADQQSFQLRTLNASRSAVATFKFSRMFFETYNIPHGEEKYCKISMKACLAVFRNMKQVEQCEFLIDADQLKFQVKLKCSLETVKLAIISIVDEENITADVNSIDNQNVISGSHRIFTEISSNFNSSEEEITLEAHNDSLAVTNYIDGSRVNDKFMRSRLRLTPEEFEIYKVDLDTTVTFCLKEFRALLLFAEAINENLSLHFREAGSPIFLKVNKPNQLESTLIMSTLSPEDVSYYEACRQSEDIRNNSRSNSAQKRKQNSTNENSKQPSKNRRVQTTQDTTLSTDSGLFRFSAMSSGVQIPRLNSQNENDINDHQILPPCNLNGSNNQRISHTNTSVALCFIDTEDAVQNSNNEVVEQRDIVDLDDDIDLIPQSPQRYRIRSIFSRCFESTYFPKEPSPGCLEYVPDSDDE